MASSSSTSYNQKTFKYDVFLSFRGEDTRKNFVDHLYDALEQQGIQTFKDDEKLEKGKRINDELLESIEDSKCYIIVFSKDYASSSWCLDELVKIMKCHNKNEQTAYPVFYDVDPSEVRKQSGAVGEAFSKHKNEIEIGKWRDALKEAANLSGWDLRKTADGHEAKVIKLIVEQILLDLRSIEGEVDENLIGMEHRVRDLEPHFENSLNDVRMIGIKGMGGAGKTTLARAIFDRLSVQFDAKSFVENVREFSKASVSGLLSLQRQVISDLTKFEENNINSVHDGRNLMKKKLRGKKVLFVLDDVDHKDQLEALAGEPNWFKLGSRIIITTRDVQVLISHRVKWIHDVSLLSYEEAIRLFSRYAFGRNIPNQEYGNLAIQVVYYAAGLPLTIKVLGSFLCGKETSEWIDALERLKTIPEEETLKKLELSYIGLENDYKEIFLDVACFLKGWDKYEAIELLESCGFHARNGLRVLEQRSLITINDDSDEEIIDMHDHIEEMGKNIVRRLDPEEPEKHSRVWIQEEVEDVLANDLGTEATRCVRMLLTPEIITKGIRNIGSMKKLRCLIVQHKRYDDDFGDFVMNDEVSQIFPDALRYLDWKAYPHRCLPISFQANNLVALKMHKSKIEQLWEGGKVLKKLKSLELRYSKLKTLHLWMIPNVERLDLKGCRDLVELHLQPIGSMKSLTYLDLHACTSLMSLSFIKHLESLKVLDLSELHLREFPDIIPGHSANSLEDLDFSYNDIEEVHSSIGNLHQLVHLHLSYCRYLKSLPQSFCNLQKLRTLYLHATGMEELPENFGHLKCLEKLELQYTHIKHLPDSICMLKHLKTLFLRWGDLESLPEDLGELESLEVLNLSYSTIRDIPSSICKLKRLKTLLLDYSEIQKLPEDLGELESLEELNLSKCKIRDIPSSICKLKRLKTLILDYSEIQKLPGDFGQIESLELLSLQWCKIKDIPESICKLKHLKKLDLYGCSELDKLPENLGDLKSLKKLNLTGTSLSHLPQSVSLENLETVGFRSKRKYVYA